jgi:hypothetical protein
MAEDSKSKLVSAVLGLLGGSAAAAMIGYFSSSSLEREKFDYALIQQALEAKSEEDRKNRLEFILDMGFISNKDWQDSLSKKLKESPEKLPQLPTSSPEQVSLLQQQGLAYSQSMISDFFSRQYETRSKAYADIVDAYTSNAGVLISLLTNAPKHFDDENAVVNTLTVTRFFTDAAVMQAKPAIEDYLSKVDALIAENPDKWTQTAKYSGNLKQRVNDLAAAQ